MTDEQPTDRTAQLESRIAELEKRSTWRSTVDDSRSGMESAFWAVMHAVFPEEARKHLKTAGREQLLAARVYLDRWIERLDEAEAKEKTGSQHEEIKIE